MSKPIEQMTGDEQSDYLAQNPELNRAVWRGANKEANRMADRIAALERDLAAAREAWAAFEERYGAWMEKQSEDVAFSSAMAFSMEYQNVQAALAQGEG